MVRRANSSMRKNDMKIAILTLPLYTNYGGILQAYALQKVLKDMGHDVWLINYREINTPKWKYYLSIVKQFLLKYLTNRPIVVKTRKTQNKDFYIISKFTQPFITENIQPQTQALFTLKQLKQVEHIYKFEAYIVGSDQIWRPKYARHIKTSFLGFLTKNNTAKKISYAASFGTDIWEYSKKQNSLCSNLLKDFNAVSVREKSAVKLCQVHFKVDANFVLDPTMLLNVTDYIKLFEKDIHKGSGGDLLTYILDSTDEKDKMIDLLACRFNYIPFKVNTKTEEGTAAIEEKIAPSVEMWLKGFQDSKFVITDSFHACVFSILFNKPFVAIGNENRGLARFESLLKMFDLNDRLITNMDQLTEDILDYEFNWHTINFQLEKMKALSKQFLIESLSN